MRTKHFVAVAAVLSLAVSVASAQNNVVVTNNNYVVLGTRNHPVTGLPYSWSPTLPAGYVPGAAGVAAMAVHGAQAGHAASLADAGAKNAAISENTSE